MSQTEKRSWFDRLTGRNKPEEKQETASESVAAATPENPILSPEDTAQAPFRHSATSQPSQDMHHSKLA